MIFHSYKKIALEIGLQIEDIEPNIEMILSAFQKKFSDTDKVFEIFESGVVEWEGIGQQIFKGGIMEFANEEEHQAWLNGTMEEDDIEMEEVEIVYYDN